MAVRDSHTAAPSDAGILRRFFAEKYAQDELLFSHFLAHISPVYGYGRCCCRSFGRYLAKFGHLTAFDRRAQPMRKELPACGDDRNVETRHRSSRQVGTCREGGDRPTARHFEWFHTSNTMLHSIVAKRDNRNGCLPLRRLKERRISRQLRLQWRPKLSTLQ